MSKLISITPALILWGVLLILIGNFIVDTISQLIAIFVVGIVVIILLTTKIF